MLLNKRSLNKGISQMIVVTIFYTVYLPLFIHLYSLPFTLYISSLYLFIIFCSIILLIPTPLCCSFDCFVVVPNPQPLSLTPISFRASRRSRCSRGWTCIIFSCSSSFGLVCPCGHYYRVWSSVGSSPTLSLVTSPSSLGIPMVVCAHMVCAQPSYVYKACSS